MVDCPHRLHLQCCRFLSLPLRPGCSLRQVLPLLRVCSTAEYCTCVVQFMIIVTIFPWVVLSSFSLLPSLRTFPLHIGLLGETVDSSVALDFLSMVSEGCPCASEAVLRFGLSWFVEGGDLYKVFHAAVVRKYLDVIVSNVNRVATELHR